MYTHYNNDNNNTVEHCRFGYERIYFFLSSALGDTKKEVQFIRTNANHPMLTSPHTHARRTMWCLRSQFISAYRDPNRYDLIRAGKNQPPNSTVEPQLKSFLKSLNSLDHAFRIWRQLPTQFTLASFPVWEFILTDDDWHILSARVCVYPVCLRNLNQRRRVVQSLTKLDNKI